MRGSGHVTPTTDCDWMALQAGALFHHDARGRITDRREPQRARAPRLFLGRTQHGNVWRLREDLPSHLVRSLSRLVGKERVQNPAVDAVPPPPERNEAIRRLLAGAAPIVDEWRGPAYRFRGDTDQRRRLVELADGVERIEPSDAVACAALAEAFAELRHGLEQRLPCFGLRDAGEWVSVAYMAAGRGGPAIEVGVETVAEHRGRGLAGRCVAAWALAVLRVGSLPLYSASWTNRASISVARKLGLVLYGEDVHWT